MIEHLDEKAAKILHKIVEMIEKRESQHIKLDDAPGIFMSLIGERIWENWIGPIYSICHYGKLNGDLMRDPEMLFQRTHDDEYFPMSFRNDYLGVHTESVSLDGVLLSEKMQNDQVHFANTWMLNINEQQELNVLVEEKKV